MVMFSSNLNEDFVASPVLYGMNFFICVWQIYSLMSKVVGMFMPHLINMWKSNVLRVIINITLNTMDCRLVATCQYASLYCKYLI